MQNVNLKTYAVLLSVFLFYTEKRLLVHQLVDHERFVVFFRYAKAMPSLYLCHEIKHT